MERIRRWDVRVYAKTYKVNSNDEPITKRRKRLEGPDFYNTVANCLSVDIPTLDHTLNVYHGTLKEPAVIITCDKERKSEVWFKYKGKWKVLRRKPFMEKALIPFAEKHDRKEAEIQEAIKRREKQERVEERRLGAYA